MNALITISLDNTCRLGATLACTHHLSRTIIKVPAPLRWGSQGGVKVPTGGNGIDVFVFSPRALFVILLQGGQQTW